jgi:hypothetical protein
MIMNKKYSLSLPLPLASRIEALCEMHPHSPRTKIMSDLLHLGLMQVERAASHTGTEAIPYQPDTTQAVYLLNGPFDEFHGLIRKHHLAMEHAMDGEESNTD